MITPAQKRLIERIVNVFETGKPDGVYDALVVLPDGRNNSRQITYGRSQTTEQGNLKKLIKMYIANHGRFAGDFQPYMGKIGVVSLVDDEKFKGLLKTAAREDPVMRDTQDAFFDTTYWARAQRWFEDNGFELPLSMLVVYDSFIHSGGVALFLRRRFMESPPAKGGNEKKWTTAYVEARHQWLKHHQRPILRKTIYRTQTFLHEIEHDDWELAKLPILAHGVEVS